MWELLVWVNVFKNKLIANSSDMVRAPCVMPDVLKPVIVLNYPFYKKYEIRKS